MSLYLPTEPETNYLVSIRKGHWGAAPFASTLRPKLTDGSTPLRCWIVLITSGTRHSYSQYLSAVILENQVLLKDLTQPEPTTGTFKLSNNSSNTDNGDWRNAQQLPTPRTPASTTIGKSQYTRPMIVLLVANHLRLRSLQFFRTRTRRGRG